MPKKTKEMTPLMKQYWEMKGAHRDKVLLFRMGDFFEMFYEDAQLAAPLLGIALTMRNKKSGDQTPMCGVPHHSIGGQINKLLAHGHKVAICDQVEDARFAKGLVKRAVTRILSPGMVYDADTLEADEFNYLCAFDAESVCFLEATTGEFFYYLVSSPSQRSQLIKTLMPTEVVVLPETKIDVELPAEVLVSTHTLESGASFGVGQDSAKLLLSYATHMQGEVLLQTLQPLEQREYVGRMQVSADALRHLEVFKTYKEDREGSLYQVINKTLTPGGSRLFKQWLCFPLTNASVMDQRLDQVEHWLKSAEDLKKIREHLRGLGDFERKLGKVSNPNTHPRDIASLAVSLEKTKSLLSFFPEKSDQAQLVSKWLEKIQQVLVDEVPHNYKDGGIIRRGFRADLDELIELATNGQTQVSALEAKEKELTGIPTLKVRYNNVFGYYIEVTKLHTSKVPTERYQRKQTLTNAERYTTDELNELEKKVISARSRRGDLETEIYQQLRQEVLGDMSLFLQLAQFCNELDTVTGLAWLAIENNYCRPKFSKGHHLKLKASRHPVVEQSVSFVANDIEINHEQTLLLTGPNMAGKSTIMRQVAITALLAQIGSFVPATEAEVPIYDRVFTRIGASDFLSEGLSTFMVEMKETAEMLELATPQSLVILDEVGRGTSTYDGLSLAQSILEYLLTESRAMVLFATHYHELTALVDQFSELKNAHMAIHESKGDLKFLYTLCAGAAEKSYGIQVAKIAGLPLQVTKRAQGLLQQLESQGASQQVAKQPEAQSANQLDLWATAESSEEEQKAKELLGRMQELSIQTMTPLEALNELASWQQELL